MSDAELKNLTDDELLDYFFKNIFELSDCWTYSCELFDCISCPCLLDDFEEFKVSVRNS